MSAERQVLVHLASGIGNIVLATPLLLVLARSGFVVDLLLDADYPDTGQLFDGWEATRRVYVGRNDAPAKGAYEQIVAAIPPFYWRRFRLRYSGHGVYRPADALFYQNEQAYYLEFARNLGCDVSKAPHYSLPINRSVRAAAVVLAPGSKPLEMTAKRWPFFAELATQFTDVALVGTADDLVCFSGKATEFPRHVRSFIGQLSLGETASMLAGASVVVANDCGLGHVAGALGVPTVLLFGPTSHQTLGPLPANVRVLRAGLECEPCWFNERFRACRRRIDCLHRVSVTSVIQAVKSVQSIATQMAV